MPRRALRWWIAIAASVSGEGCEHREPVSTVPVPLVATRVSADASPTGPSEQPRPFTVPPAPQPHVSTVDPRVTVSRVVQVDRGGSVAGTAATQRGAPVPLMPEEAHATNVFSAYDEGPPPAGIIAYRAERYAQTHQGLERDFGGARDRMRGRRCTSVSPPAPGTEVGFRSLGAPGVSVVDRFLPAQQTVVEWVAVGAGEGESAGIYLARSIDFGRAAIHGVRFDPGAPSAVRFEIPLTRHPALGAIALDRNGTSHVVFGYAGEERLAGYRLDTTTISRSGHAAAPVQLDLRASRSDAVAATVCAGVLWVIGIDDARVGELLVSAQALDTQGAATPPLVVFRMPSDVSSYVAREYVGMNLRAHCRAGVVSVTFGIPGSRPNAHDLMALAEWNATLAGPAAP